jgi:hypothetical protein
VIIDRRTFMALGAQGSLQLRAWPDVAPALAELRRSGAYRLGTDALALDADEILFVAFAGWDVAGAKWFGYPTFWNNRQSGLPKGWMSRPTAWARRSPIS